MHNKEELVNIGAMDFFFIVDGYLLVVSLEPSHQQHQHYLFYYILQLHLGEFTLELELEEEESCNKNICVSLFYVFFFIGIACQGKDIVFRFIIEYSSLRNFGP